MFFCCPSLLLKKIGPFQYSKCFSYYVSQQHFVRKNIKYKMNLILVLAMSSIYFLVFLMFSNIVYEAFKPLCTPYCPKKTFYVQHNSHGVFNVPF